MYNSPTQWSNVVTANTGEQTLPAWGFGPITGTAEGTVATIRITDGRPGYGDFGEVLHLDVQASLVADFETTTNSAFLSADLGEIPSQNIINVVIPGLQPNSLYYFRAMADLA